MDSDYRLKIQDYRLLIAQFYILNSQLSFMLYQTWPKSSMKIEHFCKKVAFFGPQVTPIYQVRLCVFDAR
jgi:hypothetical protein